MHEVSIRRFPKYLSVLLNTTTRSKKKNSKLRKAIRNLTYLNPTKRKNSKLHLPPPEVGTFESPPPSVLIACAHVHYNMRAYLRCFTTS